MPETAGVEQEPAAPWSDLGDSRDLAAVVRRAYAASPAALAAAAAAAAPGTATAPATGPAEPPVDADPLALLRRETAVRPERRPVPVATMAAVVAAGVAVLVLVLTGAPGALIDRIRPSVATHDLPDEPPARAEERDEPGTVDTPFTYDSAPPNSAPSTVAPAPDRSTAEAPSMTSAPARATGSSGSTANRRAGSSTPPAPGPTAAPSRSSGTTVPQDPPAEEPVDEGTPAGGGW